MDMCGLNLFFFFFFWLIVDRVTSEGPETQKCLPMIVWPG